MPGPPGLRLRSSMCPIVASTCRATRDGKATLAAGNKSHRRCRPRPKKPSKRTIYSAGPSVVPLAGEAVTALERGLQRTALVHESAGQPPTLNELNDRSVCHRRHCPFQARACTLAQQPSAAQCHKTLISHLRQRSANDCYVIVS